MATNKRTMPRGAKVEPYPKLHFVRAGIEWGAAFDEAQAHYIYFGAQKIGEVIVTEGWDVRLEIIDPVIRIGHGKAILSVDNEN